MTQPPPLATADAYDNVFTGELPPLATDVITPVGTELQRRLARVTDPPKYWLVVVPEDGAPTVASFDEVQGLLAAMADATQRECAIYAFLGHKLERSKAPLRYLITPLGKYKLFAVPDEEELEVDPSAFVGTPLPTPRVTDEDETGERRPVRSMDIEPLVPEDDSLVFGDG